MGGEGHMLDMIHRLRQGREASRLNRERRNQQLKKMQMGNSLSMPDTTPEEMEYIIKETKIKKEKDARYFTWGTLRSEEHTSELQSRQYLVCRLLLEKKK